MPSVCNIMRTGRRRGIERARDKERERESKREMGGIVFTAAAADNDADMAGATFAPSNFDPTAANLLLMAKRRKRAAP